MSKYEFDLPSIVTLFKPKETFSGAIHLSKSLGSIFLTSLSSKSDE